MLAALIPLFDSAMEVHGYCVFAQRENSLMNTMQSGTLAFDSVTRIEGFELLENAGESTLDENLDIFVPINHVALYANLAEQSAMPPGRIVLILDSHTQPTPANIARIRELKAQGFRFAMRKLRLNTLGTYKDILFLTDFILLNPHRMDIRRAKPLFERIFPKLKLCAIRVDTPADFEALTGLGSFHLYQGGFFRIPADKDRSHLSPMKITYFELLQVVNEQDYDLITAADIISQDTALVLSLLSIVNRMTLNYGITSVRHAAAMLGQTELKRWMNTAIAKELCSDKPSEITRLSLLRARFAENLAPVFGKKDVSDEFFLMGLFSVLDIMLDRPIDEALDNIHISQKIYNALVFQTGDYAVAYQFLLEYEKADWQEISRLLIVHNLDMDAVYEAYLEALRWYRDLISVA
ncbi:MAG: HDOD domain-containing protein [Lachnospiraceae bacterium]|nr:HDOD domain-containing protein [Lachnospiraceae bacterium]